MSLSWLDRRYGTVTLRMGRGTAHATGFAAGDIAAAVAAAPSGGGAVPSAASANNAVPWHDALQALQSLLHTHARQSKVRRLRLVLANDFVRYLLVPWTAQRLSEVERAALAHALLVERYGERKSKWRLSLEPPRYARPALAAAIDGELLAALQTLAVAQGYRLVSLVPALVDVLERHRRRLGRVRGGWLVDAGEGRIASLAFAGDTWAQVGNDTYDEAAEPLQARLLPLLRRDALRAPPLTDGTVFLVGAAVERHGAAANLATAAMPGLLDRRWPVVQLGAC